MVQWNTIHPEEAAALIHQASPFIEINYPELNTQEHAGRALRAKSFMIDSFVISPKFARDLCVDFLNLHDLYSEKFLPYNAFIISMPHGFRHYLFISNEQGFIFIYTFVSGYKNHLILFPFLNILKQNETVKSAQITDIHTKNIKELDACNARYTKYAFILAGFITTRNLSRRVVTEMPRSLHKPGTPEHHRDIFADYHICEINPFGDEPAPRVTLGGTHASPALHERRGHLRALASGKIVPVRPAWVGDPNRGAILKDYRVKSKAEE